MSGRAVPARRPPLPAWIAALVGAALVAGLTSPVQAAEQTPSTETPVVGAFAVGDGAEATIDERDGSLQLAFAVGGLRLGYDSRTTDDRHGLGDHWSLGLGLVLRDGGTRVGAPSGMLFEADASSPSGLANHFTEDLVFDQTPGVIPAREAGGLGERAYAHALHELGGMTTYYSERGEPITQTGPDGRRIDWAWAPHTAHRLTTVVDDDDVVTSFTWTRSGVTVLRGVNLPESAEWRLRLESRRISEIVDPTGGTTRFSYAPRGQLAAVDGPSGAATQVEWLSFDDGVPRVSSLRVLDVDGAELSARTWQPRAGALSSGWPARDATGPLPQAGAAGPGYATVLSDGRTRIESTYDGLHAIVARDTVVSSPAGERTVQEQRFAYPRELRDSPTGPVLALHWSKPVVATVSFSDGSGGIRTEIERYRYDDLGRVVEHHATDGSMTTTEYDSTPAAPGRPPVGSPTRSRLTAADGLIAETRYALDPDAPSRVVAEESWTGPSADALVRTRLVEFDVGEDGVVRESRAYPSGDRALAPLVDRWDVEPDLAGGRITTTRTTDAGTDAAATATTVTSLLHGGTLEQSDVFGNVATADYDGAGRVLESRDAHQYVTRTTYETMQQQGRNAVAVTTPDGVTTTEVRDELGRVELLTDNVLDGEAAGNHVRVIETREHLPGRTTVRDAWGAETTSYTDVFGRVVKTVAPTGLVAVTRHDDAANTVTTGTTPTGDLADAELIATERVDREARTRTGSTSRRDGVAAPEVTSSFDGLGRLMARTDMTHEAGVERATTTAYGYDDEGRLIRSTMHEGERVGAPVSETTEYELTAAGDIRSETTALTPGGPQAEVSRRVFRHAAGGELTGIETDGEFAEQLFDAEGNLVQAADGTIYGYDAANRQISKTSPSGQTVTTSYWADGKRRERATSDADGTRRTTSFYWDGPTLVNDAHTVGGERAVASYLVGAARHSRSITGDAPGTRYYGSDRHGNTTELFAEDGTVAERYAYDDYGAARSAPAERPAIGDVTRNPIRFAAEYLDVDGGYHLRAREYDTAGRVFTSRDPAPLFNSYAFADLNPTTRIDPTGHMSKRDLIVTGVLAGLSVVLAAFSAGASIVGLGALAAGTGGPLALLGVVSNVAGAVFDVASLGVTVSLIVNEFHDFIPKDHLVPLTWGELVLGGGAVIAGATAGVRIGMSLIDEQVPVPVQVAKPQTRAITPAKPGRPSAIPTAKHFSAAIDPQGTAQRIISLHPDDPTPVIIHQSKKPVKRYDDRPPRAQDSNGNQVGVFDTGFAPRNAANSESLVSFWTTNDRSLYVSTSQRSTFTWPGGEWEYHVVNAPGNIHVNKDYGSKIPASNMHEDELTFPGGIRPEYIKKARNVHTGDWIANDTGPNRYNPPVEKYLGWNPYGVSEVVPGWKKTAPGDY